MSTGRHKRLKVLQRDKFICQKCGVRLYLNRTNPRKDREYGVCHHIVHRTDGGSDGLYNMVARCEPCERAEHGQPNGRSPKFDYV
jgi:5-methylcytosine-specific restriction endonuclease McrA